MGFLLKALPYGQACSAPRAEAPSPIGFPSHIPCAGVRLIWDHHLFGAGAKEPKHFSLLSLSSPGSCLQPHPARPRPTSCSLALRDPPHQPQQAGKDIPGPAGAAGASSGLIAGASRQERGQLEVTESTPVSAREKKREERGSWWGLEASLARGKGGATCWPLQV